MWREVRGERERERERERTRKGAKSNGLVQTRKNSMQLRALGAQPRRRKPAFVTHDNEASLCVKDLLGSRPTLEQVKKNDS